MHDRGFLTAPIVITGCQRSGTTLLRTMLGRHPTMLEHPDEPQFILDLYKRHGNSIKDVTTAVSYITNHPYTPTTVSYHALRKALQTDSKLRLKDLIQTYIRIWVGDNIHTKRPILKDPALIFHLPLVVHLFPQATIVHIIRDPRANVSSQITRWPHITVWEAAMMWKKAVTHGRDWAATNSQYIEVSYENLLQNPDEELQSLCQFLRVPFSNKMLDFEQETTIFTPDGTPQQVIHRTVDPSRLFAWKEQLTSTTIKLIEQCCQEEMRLWHYPLLYPTVPPMQYKISLIREQAFYRFKISGKFTKAIGRKLLWRLNLSH